MADEPTKPNLRRAIIFAIVFALVAGGLTYYLYTRHFYLKWRFFGGEEEKMAFALKNGKISPKHIEDLVSSGASLSVKLSALNTMRCSNNFIKPCPRHVVDAVLDLAKHLPSDRWEREKAAYNILFFIGWSGQENLFPAVEILANDPSTRVRCHVWFVFNENDFGERGLRLLEKLSKDPAPEARCTAARSLLIPSESLRRGGKPILRRLFSDPDPSVKKLAVGAIGAWQCQYSMDMSEFWPQIRTVLESQDEDGEVRSSALWALYKNKLLSRGEIVSYVDDPDEDVTNMARLCLICFEKEKQSP